MLTPYRAYIKHTNGKNPAAYSFTTQPEQTAPTPQNKELVCERAEIDGRDGVILRYAGQSYFLEEPSLDKLSGALIITRLPGMIANILANSIFTALGFN